MYNVSLLLTDDSLRCLMLDACLLSHDKPEALKILDSVIFEAHQNSLHNLARGVTVMFAED